VYVEVEVALRFIVANLGRLETHHPIYQTRLKPFYRWWLQSKNATKRAAGPENSTHQRPDA
jgi:hypothetical protein